MPTDEELTNQEMETIACSESEIPYSPKPDTGRPETYPDMPSLGGPDENLAFVLDQEHGGREKTDVADAASPLGSADRNSEIENAKRGKEISPATQ